MDGGPWRNGGLEFTKAYVVQVCLHMAHSVTAHVCLHRGQAGDKQGTSRGQAGDKQGTNRDNQFLDCFVTCLC